MKSLLNHLFIMARIVIMTMILAACVSSPTKPNLQNTMTPATHAEIYPTASETVAVEDLSLALSEQGPYTVDTRDMKFTDPTRGGQEIEVRFWLPGKGDRPDLSGAPYPVIIYSHGGDISDGMIHRFDNSAMLRHLASYGYVAVAPEHNTEAALTFTDRPMDILALIADLDRLAGGAFKGLLDMTKIGMLGISGGTPTVLQMGGARLDNHHFDTWCANTPGGIYCPPDIVDRYHKAVSENLLQDSNGLYYVNSDERIRALAVMSPCFEPMFGERGLATVSLPVLLLAPMQEEFGGYSDETVPMYQNLGSKDRYLVNIVSGSHNSPIIPTMSHNVVLTAFFGYYLKGQEKYARYLTEDYVNTLQRLSWGVSTMIGREDPIQSYNYS